MYTVSILRKFENKALTAKPIILAPKKICRKFVPVVPYIRNLATAKEVDCS